MLLNILTRERLDQRSESLAVAIRIVRKAYVTDLQKRTHAKQGQSCLLDTSPIKNRSFRPAREVNQRRRWPRTDAAAARR